MTLLLGASAAMRRRSGPFGLAIARLSRLPLSRPPSGTLARTNVFGGMNVFVEPTAEAFQDRMRQVPTGIPVRTQKPLEAAAT